MKFRHTLFLFLFCSLFASYGAKQVYIVYFGGHNENKTPHEVEQKHYSYLLMVKGNKEAAKASLLYSYKHSINGFAAFLTAFEASKLSALKEVMHVVKSHPRKYTPQTTKSWDFLDLKELNVFEDYKGDQLSTGSSLLSRARYGKDVIVGIFDTGVWPESKSFADDGMDPIPESWIEKCRVDPDFDDSFHCNGKIMGAKYYFEDFEKEYGQLSLTYNKRSPRDTSGHGTHVASIVSGRKVKDVASLDGFAFGNASGGAPMTRLVIYKVCWRKSSFESDCKEADIIKAIDDAIADGVHVMSFSIGSRPGQYSKDLVSIAKLHATKKNIIVVCSGGNEGPGKETMLNEAPWVITVGSSSINRMFLATLELGDGTKIKGQTIASYGSTSMLASLVYAGSAENLDVNENATGHCTAGSLNSDLVDGKMVLCKSNLLADNVITEIREVMRAKGSGIIFADTEVNNGEYMIEAYALPVIFLTFSDGDIVFKYIMSNNDSASVSIGISMTTENDKPSPSVMATSSRGPTTFYKHILKPDVIAPGLNILAAWSEMPSLIKLLIDTRITKYNIRSGTSIATPHVTAVVSLLRAIYSDWSDAAIRSAILTTASPYNRDGASITDHKGVAAIPFSIGHGHLQPTKAVDPGLVYDASFDDYLTYLCTLSHSTKVRDIDPTFKCPIESHSYDLNHPSITIPFIFNSKEIKRRVTNVGAPKSSYRFEATPPLGFLVKSTPDRLHFDYTGEIKSFTITVSKNVIGFTSRLGSYAFGYYIWEDTSSHNKVRSPIVINLE